MGEPNDLDVIDPPASESTAVVADDDTATATDESSNERAVHGVLLAAGTSSRYGDRNKLLEPIDEVPIVVRAARTLLEGAVEPVTVVVGHEADRVRAALEGLNVEFVSNENYAEGQSTSVATAVGAVRDRNADAVLIALGDMPEVDPATIDLLVDTYRRGGASAVAAAYQGKRGNPVLFDRQYFDALADVDGDVGGREILLSDSEAVAVETGDPGVRYDVDRPGDR